MKSKQIVVIFFMIFNFVLSVYSVETNKFGLNTHNYPCGFENNQILKNRLVDLGVTWIRVEIPWYVVEPRKGMNFNDFNYVPSDKIVRFAQENNINILFILAYSPKFYGGHSYLMTRYISKWQIFVREMVERYDGDGHKDMPGLTKPIKYWSLWNEPNLRQFWNNGTLFSNASSFVRNVLRSGIDALRDADPLAKICGPDLSSSSFGNPEAWLQYFTNELGTCFDVLTHHQYDARDKPYKRYRAALLFRNKA